MNAPEINALAADLLDAEGGTAGRSGIALNAARGRAFEEAFNIASGAEKVGIRTVSGSMRYVDAAFRDTRNGKVLLAVELKSGSADLSKFIINQIAKDESLLSSGQVQGVLWIIEGNASDRLLQALRAAGIQVVIKTK